jgi:hypothetical protein
MLNYLSVYILPDDRKFWRKRIMYFKGSQRRKKPSKPKRSCDTYIDRKFYMAQAKIYFEDHNVKISHQRAQKRNLRSKIRMVLWSTGNFIWNKQKHIYLGQHGDIEQSEPILLLEPNFCFRARMVHVYFFDLHFFLLHINF